MRLFVCRPLPLDVRARVPEPIEVEVHTGPAPPTRAQLLAGAQQADGLVTLLSDQIDAALFAACPGLRVVANYAVGYDNIDVLAASAHGVRVTNTPDVLTEATADLTWALLLSVARRVREGQRLARSGAWSGWAPSELLGLELSGRTLGIVGPGRIGQAVARRARGFGMRVLTVGRPGSGGVELTTMLAEAHVVSLHCPLTNDTHHLIGAAELAQLRRGAVLLNTARGPIVDEAALVAALEAGHLRGAGLDVFENEPAVHPGLVGRDDVVLLPHLGSATEHTRRRMAEMAVHDAVAVLEGREPMNPVEPELA